MKLRCVLSLVAIFFSFSTRSFAGFSPDTLVHLPTGMAPIKALQAGDSVLSFDGNNNRVLAVVHAQKYSAKKAMRVMLDCDETIICSRSQKFYLPNEQKWVTATVLHAGDCLLCHDGGFANVATVSEVREAHELCDISVRDTHVFYAGKRGILVHNAFPLMFTIGWTIGEGIELGVALAGALGWLGVKFFKDGQKLKTSTDIQATSHTFGSGGPKKDDEDNDKFWKKLKERADKIGRSSRFGKIFRDPLTGLWWAKDLAQHGGSCYKVFKEGSRGFEWLFDAAKNGIEIANKHKGPTGTLIPYKEIIFRV